jgi:hypothetical protein
MLPLTKVHKKEMEKSTAPRALHFSMRWDFIIEILSHSPSLIYRFDASDPLH